MGTKIKIKKSNALLNIFKNCIFTGDRLYFSYDFIDFLIKNNLKYIIRIKGKGKFLNQNTELRRSVNKYEKIINVRNNSRVVTCKNIIPKIVYAGKNKKKIKKHKLKIRNDCNIVTNLDNTYSDENILDLYRSRWDIEVFFKYLKSNFKFRHISEKSKKNCKKMYLCELIITLIAKIIEKHYVYCNKSKKSNINYTYKFNKKNLVDGIFNTLIYSILKDSLSRYKFNNFCRAYMISCQNKKNRSFPRISKTPFSKWYIKSYSELTKYMKIINAVKTNSVNNLNKNLRVIAKNIVSID
jgi:hypothetical protein